MLIPVVPVRVKVVPLDSAAVPVATKLTVVVEKSTVLSLIVPNVAAPAVVEALKSTAPLVVPWPGVR
jgi:hypothetical protein